MFDIFFSLTGLVLLSPLLLAIFFTVKLTSRGPAIYVQKRVGKDGRDFDLYKFRSMFIDSDKKGLLTVGGNDPRITSAGAVLRKYKLDELPQLVNVLKGDMSFVGPRPEVRRFVELYNSRQKKVLSVRPGITDPASVKYRNENDLLTGSKDPDSYYISEIMPDKLEINLEYIENNSLTKDIRVILDTFKSIVIHRD